VFDKGLVTAIRRAHMPFSLGLRTSHYFCYTLFLSDALP
jgi:hypothetical protein